MCYGKLMTHYTKISNKINQVVTGDKVKGLKWLNIINPKKKEIEFLRKNFDFKLSHLQVSSSNTISHRTFVKSTNDYTFMVLHFPVIVNNSIRTGEIEFFIGDDYIVTLHNDVKSLTTFFSRYKKNSDLFPSIENSDSATLLYEILYELLNDCYSMIDLNSKKIEEIEELIFSHKTRTSIPKILFLKRDIINARKMLQNHKNIIKNLVNTESHLNLSSESKKVYLELLELSKRVWESFENQKEMLSVLSNTNDALLNYKISDIMKTLTLFSVIVFPLTLFAALFGMNVEGGMPLLKNKFGFWIVISIMALTSYGMLIYFKRKKWL